MNISWKEKIQMWIEVVSILFGDHLGQRSWGLAVGQVGIKGYSKRANTFSWELYKGVQQHTNQFYPIDKSNTTYIYLKTEYYDIRERKKNKIKIFFSLRQFFSF